MQGTKLFRDRYAKFLRKQLHQPRTMQQYLDDWFCKYKVTASEGSRPARGRLDPCHQVALFTVETKPAVENCKEKAEYLSDPLPLQQMYDSIPPNPNSNHGLTEYLSRRGGSKLEAFHDRATHYGNSGMRASLADNLNLSGTARHNLAIRHKRRLIAKICTEDRKKISAAWEKIPPYWNHTELAWINAMATRVGATRLPFAFVEELKEDTGERFFSEHMAHCKPGVMKHDELGMCQCALCYRQGLSTTFAGGEDELTKGTTAGGGVNRRHHHQQQQQQQQQAKPATVSPPVVGALILYEPRQKVGPANYLQGHDVNSQDSRWRCGHQRASKAPPPLLQQQTTPNILLPYYYPPGIPVHYFTPPSCCAKYQRWLLLRVGRPPHSDHCCNNKKNK